MRISAWRTKMGVMREARLKHQALVPAKAGTQSNNRRRFWLWIPAFAGMSGEGVA